MASDSFWVVACNKSLWSYLVSFYDRMIERWTGAFVSAHPWVLYINMPWFQKFSRPLVHLMVQDICWGPVNSIQHLPFQASHSSKHKCSVVKTLLHRAKTHSFPGVNRKEEEQRITTTLRRNGYHSCFVIQWVRKISTKEMSFTSQQPNIKNIYSIY